MIALGGNALSPKKESGTIIQQFSHTRKSLEVVMHFVRTDCNICITHGNGPQVGAELSKNEIAMDIIPPLPLNVLVANTQGAIGYMIQQSLQNALYKVKSEREVVTFISQMKINRKDKALKNIGSISSLISKEIIKKISNKKINTKKLDSLIKRNLKVKIN